MAQITCCRLKHKGRNQCDQESLVLPLLGFWYQLMRKDRHDLRTARVSSPENSQAKALYDLMCNQRDKIFPKRFQFVKGRTTTNDIEKRVLFGDLIQRVECTMADRLRPRYILGATNVYGGEGPSLKVLTQNVTILIAARLREVLFHANASNAGVVA